MSLLNIYIVLAYYDKSEKNIRPLQFEKNKITGQKFNEEAVNEQILRISRYKQSALHWNRTLVEDSLLKIYRLALDNYERLSSELGIKVHPRKPQERYFAKLVSDLANFSDISLRGSAGASLRELKTVHSLEYLSDGAKEGFGITNYLGGTYYLTADEVIRDENRNLYIIQESKNSSMGFSPSISDIKDGLFKLILYSNLHSLELHATPVNFTTRLKLTGKRVSGRLSMPCSEKSLEDFLTVNAGNYSQREADILLKLNLEASNNNKLEIQVSPNI